MPHFFDRAGTDKTNRSRQALGTATYGLDHGHATARRMQPRQPYTIDLVVCTTGDTHLMSDIQSIGPLFHHHPTGAEPIMLGFECHKLLRDARGRYDYYAFVEDDVVITDPLFFKKRRVFDQQ